MFVLIVAKKRKKHRAVRETEGTVVLNNGVYCDYCRHRCKHINVVLKLR